jgi:hypothetical protein
MWAELAGFSRKRTAVAHDLEALKLETGKFDETAEINTASAGSDTVNRRAVQGSTHHPPGILESRKYLRCWSNIVRKNEPKRCARRIRHRELVPGFMAGGGGRSPEAPEKTNEVTSRDSGARISWKRKPTRDTVEPTRDRARLRLT